MCTSCCRSRICLRAFSRRGFGTGRLFTCIFDEAQFWILKFFGRLHFISNCIWTLCFTEFSMFGGKWHNDPITKDVFVFHSLLSPFCTVLVYEAQNRTAARDAQHFPTAVVGQASEPVADALAVFVCWQVINIEQSVALLIQRKQSYIRSTQGHKFCFKIRTSNFQTSANNWGGEAEWFRWERTTLRSTHKVASWMLF